MARAARSSPRGRVDAIAGLLDLVRLEGLTLDCRFAHGGSGRLRLTGRLKADVSANLPSCRSTPSRARIDMCRSRSSFGARRCWRPRRAAPNCRAALSVLDGAEPIVCGRIDLGAVAYETLATVLDPYPKRKGVGFDWLQSEPNQAQEAQSGPFAALAPLKRGERQAYGKIRLSLAGFFSLFGFHFRGVAAAGPRQGYSLS